MFYNRVLSYFQRNVTEHVPKIFDAVFECTLEMINKVSMQIYFTSTGYSECFTALWYIHISLDVQFEYNSASFLFF